MTVLKQPPVTRSFALPAVDWRKLLLAACFVVIGVTQAYNMLAFPFYDNTEGTNMASAWSILRQGSVSPYTYTYENPPLGWLVLTSGMILGEVVPPDGESILSGGRVAMLITHILTAGLVYAIARKLRVSFAVALLAMLIFSLSPLTTVLQRRILLENIMTFWMLVAFYFVIGKRRMLVHYAASAFALGLAFLTHIIAQWFIPAILFAVFKHTEQSHRRFVISLFAGILVCLLAVFPFHALLKEELFPAGFLFGGSHPHVSLLETQSDLFKRISLDEFLDADSSLVHNINRWTDIHEAASDPVFMVVGFASAGLIIFAAISQPYLRPFALLLIFYGFHVSTLRQLFDPALIPLLPLFAISTGIVMQGILNGAAKISHSKAVQYALYAGLVAVTVSGFGSSVVTHARIYTLDQVSMQREAVRWIRENLPHDAILVTDNFAFVDLRDTMPNVHYYWVADVDPAVRVDILENNWCNIDYLLTTAQMLNDIDRNGLRLVSTANRNSVIVQEYENNGWPLYIREIRKHNCDIPFP